MHRPGLKVSRRQQFITLLVNPRVYLVVDLLTLTWQCRADQDFN